MILGAGRWCVAIQVACSPGVANSIRPESLKSRFKANLDSRGITAQGQPGRIPSPLVVNVQEVRWIGRNYYEVSCTVYLNLSSSVDSTAISDLFSQSWNQARSPGSNECPPGPVFDIGTKAAAQQWTQSHAIGESSTAAQWITSFGDIFTTETFYQCRIEFAPVPPSGDIPTIATDGIANTIAGSRIMASSEPSMVGQTLPSVGVPSMTDVANAAHAAGTAINHSLTEGLAGATGMNSSDVRIVVYAVLGIGIALAATKVIREFRKV